MLFIWKISLLPQSSRNSYISKQTNWEFAWNFQKPGQKLLPQPDRLMRITFFIMIKYIGICYLKKPTVNACEKVNQLQVAIFEPDKLCLTLSDQDAAPEHYVSSLGGAEMNPKLPAETGRSSTYIRILVYLLYVWLYTTYILLCEFIHIYA